MQRLTPCSMVVPCSTSLASIVPQITWMRICLPLKNILCMYVIPVGKSGLIVAHRCRAIPLHCSSCSWLAVACCSVSGSLLRCRLPQHRSMHVARKQPSVNQPLPPSRMQEMFHILHNQSCFLCLLTLRVPPVGLT